MNNKQEGFQTNQNDFYDLIQVNPFVKALSAPRIMITKNKFKMSFKSPLTIFNNVLITQAPDQPYKYGQLAQNQTNKGKLNGIFQKTQIVPLQSIIYRYEKTNQASMNEENKAIFEKPSDVFPKRFICIYNKLHQNVFLKNDLTIVVKNIVKYLKFEQLKSIQLPFNFCNTNLTENLTNLNQKSLKQSRQIEKQKNIDKRSRRSQNSLPCKKSEQAIVNKQIDFSNFQFQKSLILQNQTKTKKSQIEFMSNFQSGNLHLVFKDKIFDNTFYLFLTNDTNTHGFNQWFYFGLKCNFRQKKHFRFIIMNISKEFKFQSRMRLLTLKNGQFKRQVPFNVYKNKYSRYNGGNLLSLDFFYEFQPQKQEPIFFCFGYPYTYSRLLNFLKQIKSKTYKNLVVTIESLGKTQLTNCIASIKIERQHNKKSTCLNAKKTIVIIARQHASQTPSSFICQSLVRQLLSQGSKQYQVLLQNFKFIIIPMSNPDGVIHGNSRTNIKGYDINRLWEMNKLNNVTTQSAQTESINNYLNEELLKSTQIEYLVDLHSHSKEYGSFVYCCDYSQNNRLFNYFFTLKYPECSYQKCKFNIASDKKCTLRGQMYHRLGIKTAFTIETSFYGFKKQIDQQNQSLIPFTYQNFENISKSILFSLVSIQRTKNKIQEKKQILKAIQQLDNKIKFFEKSKNKQKSRQNDNQSDSDPENQYLQMKQRQQNGQNLKGYTQKKLNESQNMKYQRNAHLNSHKVNQKRNMLNQTKSLQLISKIECTFQSSNDVNFKRKKVYSTKNQSVKRVNRQGQNQNIDGPMPKKYPSISEKQLDFRKTLRRGFRMAKSQTQFYKQNLQTQKQQVQQQQGQKSFITYPTQTNISIKYDHLRALHQSLFKGTVKVKAIKQQGKLLRRIGKSRGVSLLENSNKRVYQNSSEQSRTIFKNNYIQNCNPLNQLGQYLTVQKINKAPKYSFQEFND